MFTDTDKLNIIKNLIKDRKDKIQSLSDKLVHGNINEEEGLKLSILLQENKLIREINHILNFEN